MPKARLKVGSRCCIKRLARGAQHLMHDAWHSLRTGYLRLVNIFMVAVRLAPIEPLSPLRQKPEHCLITTDSALKGEHLLG
jgi:hypothetical protein